ncbi:MAG TPA: site-2 protease family protein [Kineosporiaceae bacterium]|nr:site-2 protease family protein [Kineosporiaceae bacterium]
MSTPVEGGRPLLRGRLFGFPVHLDLSFVLIMGFLGWAGHPTLRGIVVWVVVATLAVLAHEFGHAVVARTTGAHPHITLSGFGGVTTFAPPQPLSRARSLAISVAGPFVGLVLGAALVVLAPAIVPGTDPASWLAGAFAYRPYPVSWQVEALDSGIFVCFAWSVLNLLPVLPLDGGQAMRELLPGSPQARARRAAMVSVVTAALVVLAAVLSGQVFVGLFMLMFAVMNILSLRESGPRAGQGTVSPEQAVVERLWHNDPAGARQLLVAVPEGMPVDLAVHGAVLALTGDRAQGHALLQQEVGRRPGDVNAVALLVLTQVLEHDWDAVLAGLQSPLRPLIPPPVLQRAVAEARGTGREDVAGRIAALAMPPAPPGPVPPDGARGGPDGEGSGRPA